MGENEYDSALYHNPDDDKNPSQRNKITPPYGLRVVESSWLQGAKDRIVFRRTNQRIMEESLRKELTDFLGVPRIKILKKLGLDVIKDAVESPTMMLGYLNCAVFSRELGCSGCLDDPSTKCVRRSYRDNLKKAFTREQLIKLTILLEGYSKLERLEQ